MHLGVVSFDYRPAIGGLGVVADLYVRELQKKDSELRVTVISPSPDADEHVSALAARRWKKPGGCPLFSFFFNLRLHSIVARHRLDVLHLHAGSGGVFLLRRACCPVLVTAHHTYAQEASLLFRSSPLKRLWKYLLSFAERRTYRLADRIICVSEDTANALETRYGVPRKKISVIENPIDDIFFRTHTRSVVPQSFVYVGRIEERKGVMTLLRAFALFAAENPHARLTLVGANLLGETLTSVLRTLNIDRSVRLTGYLSQEERIAEMCNAEVVIVPSILEGFGLVAAESMALGTPVIASDCDGLRSVVQSGVNGFLFRTGSPEDLHRVLQNVTHDAALLKEISTRARAEAVYRFSLSARAEDLLTCIRSLTERTNK